MKNEWVLKAAIAGICLGSGVATTAGVTGCASQERHLCAGWNSCKGKGADGKNACAGKGACATITSAGKGLNECKGMGGCKTESNGCYGNNACKGKGGCKVPSDKWKKNK